MYCRICGRSMDFEDNRYRTNERIWFCDKCDIETPEDITGELIAWHKDTREPDFDLERTNKDGIEK